MTDNERKARAWLTRAMVACRCKPNVAEATLCWTCAIAALLAAVRAEQERIADQFHEQYHDAPCVDIGKNEVQAFLDARCIHNGVPEPPR